MELDKVIGTGAQATVYSSENYAVKLFKENYNKTDVFYEALINSIIENTQLRVPKTYEVLSIDNQMAIKMDYIKGESLFNCIFKDEDSTEAYMKQMIRIQLEIHSKRVYLPFLLKDKLKNKIQGNENLSIAHKENMLTLLNDLPEGNELCHGDFHGYNILVCEGEYWIIDWIDSTTGCADGDACRTYLLYSLYFPELAEMYLMLYCKETGKEKERILAWLPVLAAARLSENIGNEEEKLMSIINDTIK
ncbi:phosphotransferase [Oceanirhabdus sp. W0125-5]|uniref:phosphotransferase n=1 Tax=Oceanirhabdus sp. W0125-5 TaxID=2999116 RepID=UPI0022F2DD86|nr:phosphotransferase [Oceanirhabdus sp. W0125-5]WBW95702.1 phosphotransferase [Oceanirhabdus sp. W0125-5]